MRVVLTALAGAVIVFVVSAILHTVTPLGTTGLEVLPKEQPVLDAFRANVPHSGLYMFPAPAETPHGGPYGLLVITNEGSGEMSPQQLVLEFITNFIAALFAAWVLTLCRASYGARVLVVVLFALFAFASISASHWIWYKFPAAFILAELVMEVIAWLLAGLAMAKMTRPATA